MRPEVEAPPVSKPDVEVKSSHPLLKRHADLGRSNPHVATLRAAEEDAFKKLGELPRDPATNEELRRHIERALTDQLPRK